MKTIGLIGGTGWTSSAEYYRIINEETNRRLGGLNFAKCILFSINYGEIDALNQRHDMKGVFSLVRDAADRLVFSGAECIVICANTLHQFAEELERQIDIPLIHIGVSTVQEIQKKGFACVGLLGTKQTMEMDFYRAKLNAENIKVVVPPLKERDFIQSAITDELLKGIIRERSRSRFLRIMQRLRTEGAEGVVLGCTEIPLLIRQEDTDIPLFNTLLIHSLAAVDFALSER